MAFKHSYRWFVIKLIYREGISCSFLETVHSTEFFHTFSQQNALTWMKNCSRPITAITLLMFCDFRHLKSDQQQSLQDPGIVWSNFLSFSNIFQAWLSKTSVCLKIEVTKFLEYLRSLGLEYQLPEHKNCLNFYNLQNVFWITV